MPVPRIVLAVLFGLIVGMNSAIADGPELKVRPDSLFFRQIGSVAPLPQQLSVFAEDGPLGAFTAAASTTSGGNWLSVSPGGGSGPATLAVSVNTAGMNPGEYSGRITVAAPGLEDSPRTVRVQLEIRTAGGGAPLAVRPDEFEFELVQGGPAPAPRQLAVFPAGGGAWTASTSVRNPAGGRWLRVTPAAGSGNAVLQVEVDPTGLTRGEYEGIITITSGGSTARVEVELEVEGPRPPRLRLDPRAFNFAVEPNSATPPAPRTLRISNSGGGTFAWTAAATVSTPPGGRWLSVTPTAGSGPGQVTLRVDPAGLAPGMYLGRITVTSGTNREEASVFLRVLGPARPSVKIRPKSLTFTMHGGVASPASRRIDIKSKASGLSYTATASTARGGNWLRVSPASGPAPGSFTASVDAAVAAPLAAGVYTGTILVRVPGAAEETHNVHVALRVNGAGENPRLEVEPGGLAFTATRGGPNPAARRVELEPEGIASLAWTAAVSTVSGGNWLSVSPTSGTTTRSAESQVNVSVNIAGLAAGAYVGNVTFTPAAASGARPVTVEVRLVITAPAGSGSTTPAITGSHAERNAPGGGQAVAAGPLVALFTEPAHGFITQVDMPLNVSVLVLDSAGAPVEGATVAVRSSGPEPEMALTDLGDGEYTGVFRALSSGRLVLAGAAQIESRSASQSAPAFAISGDMESASGEHSLVFQGGMVSAASFAESPTPLAPGSLVSLFGRRIAGRGAAARSLPLPSSLAGVSVTVGGIPAPLLSATSGPLDQINFQVPFELDGAAQADVVVNNNGVLSVQETIALAPSVPALFTVSQTGIGAAAALHGADFSAVTAGRPAAAREVILL